LPTALQTGVSLSPRELCEATPLPLADDRPGLQATGRLQSEIRVRESRSETVRDGIDDTDTMTLQLHRRLATGTEGRSWLAARRIISCLRAAASDTMARMDL
jgi:hypothetical protein